MPLRTSGRNVARASGAMRRTASSPASMSTPASRYVKRVIRLRVEEGELRRRLRRDAHAVVPGETGMAELRRIGAGGLQHALQGEIAERVRGEVSPDLLDVVAGSDELLARRRVDPVVAGPLDRWGRDAHVHLARPGAADHLHDLAARGPAHDGVVHHHDAAALEHLPHRVELHLHAEVADALLWLDEGSAPVVGADEAPLVPKAPPPRVTHCPPGARVWDP